MRQSGVEPIRASPLDVVEKAVSSSGERKLRRVSVWLMLFFLFQGGLGAVWDREWHAYVGRDQFWTPPHTLIYSCVAGVGLMAFALVLVETFRYRRGAAGASDSSMVRVFWFFHAPLGFVITGFGALLALIAAPLDNYWHELYGIDITLWAPFHMMGVTGGVIGIVGVIYVFASEAAIDRQLGYQRRRLLGLNALEWGALLVMASLMEYTLTGFLQFPLASLGPLNISSYPLPLVAGATFCFVGALGLTRRPGVATYLVLFLLLNTLAVELFIPWAIRTAVAAQGLTYRPPGRAPAFSWAYALLPLVYLLSAFMVDGAAFWSQRRHSRIGYTSRSVALMGAIITPPIVVLAPFILHSYSTFAPIFLPQPGLPVPLSLSVAAYLLFSLVVLGFGVLGAVLGADFGAIWRHNTR
ncbi:MAG TPA: hypothetical protein VFU32_04670 [Ktedonobacterales bacterium]|nr:hypothetical protein [Ktedonobacterales bacterium]